MKKTLILFFLLTNITFANSWNPGIQLKFIDMCSSWSHSEYQPKGKVSVWNLSSQKYYDHKKACRDFILPYQYEEITPSDFAQYFKILQHDRKLKNGDSDLIVLFTSENPVGDKTPPPFSNGYPLTLISTETTTDEIYELKKDIMINNLSSLDRIKNKRTGSFSLFYFSHMSEFKSFKRNWLSSLSKSETDNKEYRKIRK